MESHEVKIYIYDLSQGMARTMSGPLLGKQLDGIWHTGVVVYGQEIFYGGSGIDRCDPGGTILGQPHKVEIMGKTEIPFDIFMDYVIELGNTTFRGESYHLFNRNCNNFSNELSLFLTGKPIPSYITSLPEEVLSTPLGSMLRPFLDAMSVNPGGGTPINDFYQTSSNEPPTDKNESSPAPTASFEHHCISQYEEHQEIQVEILAVQESIQKSLGADRKLMFEEMVEYFKQSKPDWGLGRGHINLIEYILRDSAFSTDQKRGAAGLLQEFLLQGDIVAMMKHDPTKTYGCILEKFEQHQLAVQQRLAKGLCNFSSHSDTRDWLLGTASIGSTQSNNNPIVCSVVRQCLLHTDPALRGAGAAQTNTITAEKISEEVAFDLGCAVIDLMQKDLEDDTAHTTMVALCQCITSNHEVAAIAAVSGLDVDAISKKYPKLHKICHERLQPHLSKYS